MSSLCETKVYFAFIQKNSFLERVKLGIKVYMKLCNFGGEEEMVTISASIMAT